MEYLLICLTLLKSESNIDWNDNSVYCVEYDLEQELSEGESRLLSRVIGLCEDINYCFI